jgi:hypothetical protein
MHYLHMHARTHTQTTYTKVLIMRNLLLYFKLELIEIYFRFGIEYIFFSVNLTAIRTCIVNTYVDIDINIDICI